MIKRKKTSKKEETKIKGKKEEKILEDKSNKEEKDAQTEIAEEGILEKPLIEFIPIDEIKKQGPKKVSLEEELFFQEEQSSRLDLLPSPFIEEKRKNEENPYLSQKENPYSTKKDDKRYSAPAHLRISNITREQIKITTPDLSSPLTTFVFTSIRRDIPLIRMPNQEEAYQQDLYEIYKTEKVSLEDLSRKTRKHREVDMKYEVD